MSTNEFFFYGFFDIIFNSSFKIEKENQNGEKQVCAQLNKQQRMFSPSPVLVWVACTETMMALGALSANLTQTEHPLYPRNLVIYSTLFLADSITVTTCGFLFKLNRT